MTDRRRSAPERRRAARAPLVAAVKEHVGEEVRLALSQDVGPSGMKLKRVVGSAWLPRTRVSVMFELPDGGEVVRALGAVVFERAEGNYCCTGIRFEDLSPLDYARIQRYVSRSR